MKKITLILLLAILIGILILTGTRFKWNTRDEWKGPVSGTCEYTGIWNVMLHIRLPILEKCNPI